MKTNLIEPWLWILKDRGTKLEIITTNKGNSYYKFYGFLIALFSCDFIKSLSLFLFVFSPFEADVSLHFASFEKNTSRSLLNF